MKVVRFNNDGFGGRYEYETEITNIREIAQEFGQSADTLELYDDDGNLVSAATWPQGYKKYKYCTGKNMDANPLFRVYVD